MNYPQVLQLETTAACNAHCGFCPHNSMGRKGAMADDLITKIIDEIALWPVKPASVCPFLTNEPFADPRIFGIAERIRKAAPAAELTFFTNASLLDDSKRQRILRIPGVTKFFCSLHHITPGAYMAELGLDFDRTVRNIKALAAESPTPVTVLRVGNGTALDAQFVEWVRKNIPRAIPMVAVRWNWKGDIKTNEVDMFQNIHCPRSTSLVVLHDGRVALCCMDNAGEYELGNVNHQSMLEIFNGERWHRFFDSPKNSKAPCNKCNMH